jgi:glycosyltransferase involved in cell wall biosynthesis
LVLFEFPSVSGGENSFLSTVSSVQQAGFELIAAAPPCGPLADALREHAVATSPLTMEPHLTLARRREMIAQTIRLVMPNLVHSNSLAMARLAGPVARRARLPSIGHLRDIVRLSRAAIEDLNANTRLLAVSNATRDWHVSAGVSSQNTVVLHNGIDIHRFCPAPATGWLHRELRLPLAGDNVRLLGAIGQIGMRKGWDVLLTAAPALIRNDQNLHLIMVGERHSRKQEAVLYEHRLHELAGEAGAAGHVHFLAHRNDVEALLPELSVFVHAARQEPFGRVLLEAGACGLPIVATDVGGSRELFPDASQACLIPPGDPQALLAAVASLLDHPRRARQMGQEARRRVASAFDHRRTGLQLVGQYQAVLMGARHVPS